MLGWLVSAEVCERQRLLSAAARPRLLSHAALAWPRLLQVALLASLVLGIEGAATASAFCRESLQSQSQGPCVPAPGVAFLSWDRSCMTYRFNDQFFMRMPRLGEVAVRQIFSTSYMTWASVNCGGHKPFFVEQFAGTTATNKAEFLYDVENESIVAARTRSEWAALKDHDANALALTLLWHDKNTGQILDVDMELNTGAGAFNDCVSSICTINMIDLQNTVTHEGGHLLGLGHSMVAGSTMEASTQSNMEVSKRSLEDDDRAGYCALMLPDFKCNGTNCSCPPAPIVSSKTVTRTCACGTVGMRAAVGRPWAWATAGLLAVVSVRWRRRQRQVRNQGPAQE
jgi:hypothetical protein